MFAAPTTESEEIAELRDRVRALEMRLDRLAASRGNLTGIFNEKQTVQIDEKKKKVRFNAGLFRASGYKRLNLNRLLR